MAGARLSAASSRATLAVFDRRWLVVCLFFIAPSIVYAGVISGGSFDPFAPTYGWRVYNWYALALGQLRQTVPADVISFEGLYIGGEVYLYYGILPALLRIPLAPFIDLKQVPLSNLFVWAMLLTGQIALQRAALRIYRARSDARTPVDTGLLVLVSFSLWFLSGTYVLAQDAKFYHEPYAAAMMLASVFVAMLARDLIVERRRPGAARLLGYAVLAGLCVFTRQTFAIGLYIATFGLLLPRWRDWRARPGIVTASASRRAAGALLIMLIAGLGFLELNRARTGHYGIGWDVHSYGGYLMEQSARLETMVDKQFSTTRVVPTFVYVLAGGEELRERWIANMGGGIVMTFGVPNRYLLFTPFALAMAAVGAVCVARRLRRDDTAGPLLVATLGLAAIAVVQLSYATFMHRYSAELWPVIAWLMLIALRDLDLARLFGHRAPRVVGTVVAVNLLSLAYIVSLRPALIELPTGRWSLRSPLPPELAARATAPGSRDFSVAPDLADAP